MRIEKIYKARESLCNTTKKTKKQQQQKKKQQKNKKKLNSNTKFL